MRALLRSLSVLLVVAGGAGAVTIPPCPNGRFVVLGPKLVPGTFAGSEDAVNVTGQTVSIESGCTPILGRVRGTRKGTKVRAKWVLGCDAVAYPMRITATIDPVTCNTMTGYFKVPKLRIVTPFTATRETAGTSCAESTFQHIQQRIFAARGCSLTTCHGASATSGLDLRPGSSLLNLINVPATNAVAAAAGKLRVVPGNAAASFLSQKVHGTLVAGEGNQMPFIGSPLTPDETALLDLWINAGAPPTGSVAGAFCLPPPTYAPVTAPAPPAGGYQIVLNGPTLQPGQESEGCMWIPVPNAADFNVGRWEFTLNPGTHHFAIFEYNRAGVPPTVGQFTLNDFGCFSGSDFGNNFTGSPQAPFYIDAYPPGVTRVLRAGTYIGLNAHYSNVYTVPIEMKVYINVFPYVGTPQHIAATIIDITDMFSISVPPFTQRIQPGRFDNFSGSPLYVFSTGGHMHKRGLRFTARRSNGTVIFDDYDWAHPTVRFFDPPLVLNPGDYIDYECLHDNGVTRPLKTDGAGNPATLFFGVTTDDEMCTIAGQYWTD